jgi:hypothetical protein
MRYQHRCLACCRTGVRGAALLQGPSPTTAIAWWCFGRDPADLAAAANAVITAGGGMAVASKGAVTAVLRLPICGLLSDAPARMLRRIPRVARSGPCDRLLATTAVDFQGHRWCQPCVQSWSACQRRRDYRREYRRYICERADSIGQGRCVRVAVPHQRLAGYLHRMVADRDCIVRILVRVADGRVNTWVKPGHDGVGAWPRRGWRVV